MAGAHIGRGRLAVCNRLATERLLRGNPSGSDNPSGNCMGLGQPIRIQDPLICQLLQHFFRGSQHRIHPLVERPVLARGLSIRPNGQN
jgi:hypothetical protein